MEIKKVRTLFYNYTGQPEFGDLSFLYVPDSYRSSVIKERKKTILPKNFAFVSSRTILLNF